MSNETLADRLEKELNESFKLAEEQLASEKLGGNRVKEEFWRGELAVLDRISAIVAKADATEPPKPVMVRRWWSGVIYLAVCVAWIVWCCHDSLAGMFWPALAVASFPVALSCAPWPPNRDEG